MELNLSPEQLRRSSYARQLAGGFSGLRFDRRLEEEFRKDYASKNFPRQRLMILFGLVLFLAFAGADYLRLSGGAQEWALTIRLGVLTPMLVIGAALAYSPLGERLVVPVVMTLILSVGATIVSIFYVAWIYGQTYQPEGLYMVVVVNFFLAGLLFWRATACAAGVLAMFGFGGLLVDNPPPLVTFYTFAFTMLNLLCAIGSYLLEKQGRISFLTSAILAEAADQDGLTGIANRRLFDVQLSELVARSLTSRRPVALLLLDLDHFKDYNDRYGHLEGDRCLRQIAQVLEDFSRRPRDLAARFGGEEFALLLYDISKEAAMHQAEAVRIAISDLAIPHTLNRPARVMTTSIGVAALDPAQGGSTVSLVAAADQALYQAKDKGRNRVELAEVQSALEE